MLRGLKSRREALRGDDLKIGDVINNSSTVSGMIGKEERKAAGIADSSFKGQLREIQSDKCEENLRQLVHQIVEQGKKLGSKVDVRELKIYKRLISEFLDEALSNSRRFSKQSFLDRRGRHRTYSVVKNINDELELLTQDVLKEEKDNIGILQRLEDIRGMLLDIVM